MGKIERELRVGDILQIKKKPECLKNCLDGTAVCCSHGVHLSEAIALLGKRVICTSVLSEGMAITKPEDDLPGSSLEWPWTYCKYWIQYLSEGTSFKLKYFNRSIQ